MVKKIKYYKPIIQWPDMQGRIIKNQPHLEYINNVHERIGNAHTFSVLPLDEEFCLYHPKTIERQRLQNKFYSKL